MFTGIVEATAKLKNIQASGTNLQFEFESSIGLELKVDQSLSHNGVCLTVEKTLGERYWLTAVQETLSKTNLGQLKIDDLVNIERCMPANGRFDGHIVQGHVDQTGICKEIKDLNGSWELSFEYDESLGNMVVEKGSICINGVSLTVFNVGPGSLSVALIPYTWSNTNLHTLQIGEEVNLEFDIVGKYIAKMVLGSGNYAQKK